MEESKRRTRTGCLTCRARRVKCDETKPTCRRCEAANVECNGYEQKRHVNARRSKRSASVVGAPRVHAAGCVSDHQIAPAHPKFREDGLPLIGFPNIPNLAQRPHDRARDLLAYHQFMFRTLFTLFPPEHLHFWRESMCEAAWDTEYIYDAIMALGTVHRCCLMRSQSDEEDQNRSMDTQVIAAKAYTTALQKLSHDIEVAKKTMPLLIGTLVFFAYLECFLGNIPATMRHILTARHYISSMPLGDGTQTQYYQAPLEWSLTDLESMCRIVVPFPKLIESCDGRIASPGNADMQTPSSDVSATAASSLSPLGMQQSFLALLSANPEISELMWSPFAPYSRCVAARNIVAFLDDVKNWKAAHHASLVANSEIEDSISDPDTFTFDALDGLSMPPLSFISVPRHMCLLLALYSFCRARLSWSLSLLGDEHRKFELEAYFFIYQQLRFVGAVADTRPTTAEMTLITCESLKVSFGPMLHLAAYCSPTLDWLQWIVIQLERIGTVGLFHSRAFAASLKVWSSLELDCSIAMRQLDANRFSIPSRRIISVLVPDVSGKNYFTFFARSRSDGRGGEVSSYVPLAVASWSMLNENKEPRLDIFEPTQQQFNNEWLMSQAVVANWTTWFRHPEFNLDRALRDHIDGGHVLHRAHGMGM